jgi:hypothetical protein
LARVWIVSGSVLEDENENERGNAHEGGDGGHSCECSGGDLL